ncbi:mycofactocin system transcriptional regulator [Saccharopolyspora karakumensis]|uniref:Mycofactocin system transcriptional regulator n=1 Tax=Saccharopolyspora karakumensis TaxID=2530386 RepID=A0A4R5BYP0_9PSEU|nr:mycofactocin system transcriptional regulator [Saccharopolyspora karakumensis]TDD90550.1 mycofactocin system transcriptional regulator [Saccharopolyspora karakumensis]
MTSEKPRLGRPVATSHAQIEKAAFRLFAEHGFDGTTIAAIAAEAGIGRRTLFRYYQSKNDIPWGQFDRRLNDFRTILNDQPNDLPLHEAVHRSIVEFNQFPDNAAPTHRERMQIILTTPELQAHSVLRYTQWRAVIADYVAHRTGHSPDDLLPRAAGHISLALSMSAYEMWLKDPYAPLTPLLEEAMLNLQSYLRN